ncbi:MAG: glycosyltransferase family 2 protein [Candidatus Saganbacteria bacterium]|nr:glycosyltransferase family 2 protein [Candidatus Saganbacteria bacterium]
MSVTIITPSFNKPRYILDAIKSVISQTHQDWTYYIIDNSTDEITRKTIREFLHKVPDDRIKYLGVNFSDVFREKVYIPSILCNAAFMLADKKYLFYLSDDDIIHESCLESMVRFLEENHEFGACYCRADRLKLMNTFGKEIWIKDKEFPFGQTFDENILPDRIIDGGQVMCGKSIIEKIVSTEGMINLFLVPRIAGAYDHSDGVFLNKLTNYTKIPPCSHNSDKILLTHRYT